MNRILLIYMRYWGLFFSLLVLIESTPAKIQDNEDYSSPICPNLVLIQENLVKHGFENVVVMYDPQDSNLIVEYENRRYRCEMTAMGVVLAIAANDINGSDFIILLSKNRDIRLVGIKMRIGDYRDFLDGQISTEIFLQRVKISQNVYMPPDLAMWYYKLGKRNTCFRKFDVTMRPGIKAQFGNFDDPYEFQLNVIPEISTFPIKGMSVTAQVIIPVKNELGLEGDRIRLGRITLNQILRMPCSFFTSASFGYFNLNRYGACGECIKFFNNGRLSFGAVVSYTGYRIYLKDKWYYSRQWKWSYLGNCTYRLSAINFSLKLMGGKFLYGDSGLRIEFLRSFGELDIGFFALKTSMGRQGGFTFRVPIFPNRRFAPKRFRITPPNSFPWAYRYRGLCNSGYVLSTGDELDYFVKRLNPVYIRNNFDEIKKVR